MGYTSEAKFEEDLISMLKDQKGWEDGVLRYKTEKELIQNWAEIIFENNRQMDRLYQYPLTDGEMEQIMEEIKMLREPYKLNEFITGGEIQIKRDNEEHKEKFGKEVTLSIFGRDKIGAGKVKYQIAQQPKFHAKDKIHKDRRGDLCLLIDGIPVIHIELKRSNCDLSSGIHQIEKYLKEGVFTGLFSLVQIFVVMTPEDCVYFANPGSYEKLNQKFCFHWADAYNNPIKEWDKIAEHLLSIPMAHQMIGLYTIADKADKTLKVMRSYQYHAASRVCQRIRKMKWDGESIYGGYVWHTTGSGKTMTSFKSAQLIANLQSSDEEKNRKGDVDKVIFLMDRTELTTQSLKEYRSFSSESESIQDTENTGDLIAKLKSRSATDTLIVTSIQKMSRIKEEMGVNHADIEKINKKRIVFIVDECHRSVFGKMLSAIRWNFPKAVFVGFSGTPILDSNKKKNTTTADVFGNELEGTRYTIADGMRDGNVLGFDTIPQPTYKDSDLRKIVVCEKAKVQNIEEVFGDPKKEKIYNHWMYEVSMGEELEADGTYSQSIEGHFKNIQYQTKEHREAVVTDILDNWMMQSRNGKYHAIFATSTIPEAIEYYRLLKSKKPELKITAVFDPSDNNNETNLAKQDGIEEILIDYSQRFFGTDDKFPMNEYDKFKRDVSFRLAHKGYYTGIENKPEKCLDILIVVDQMLTGYDSKWLNTLYMDKFYGWDNIEKIIQAFSRTNRVFDETKTHGIVRYYRRPYTMRNIIEYAFGQYSGNKTLGIFVLKLKENLEGMNEKYEEIKEIFEDAGILDFEKLPDDMAEKRKFSKLFNELNKYLEPARIQGFTWEKVTYEFSKTPLEKEIFTLKFDKRIYDILLQRYKELRRGKNESIEEDAYDINPYLMALSTEKIDSDYMDSRFKRYVKMLRDNVDEKVVQEMLNDVHRSFASLSIEQQGYAEILLKDIQDKILVVEESKTIMDYIIEYETRAKSDEISRFSKYLGLDEEKLRSIMKKHVTEDSINEFGQFDELIKSADIATAKKYFDQVEKNDVPKRKVRMKLDGLLRKFILEGGFRVDM